MKKLLGTVFLVVVLLLSACGGGNKEIVIGGKPWTEQIILPHILGIYIEAKTDIKVKYEESLGEVSIMTPAIEKGEIDLYVEYTGTGLMDVLKEDTESGESAESVYNRVKKGYEEELGVTWLKPLGFENTYTLAYSKENNQYNISTYSELAELSHSGEMVFGGPHAFYELPSNGYDDLVEEYGFNFVSSEGLDPNIMYDAVKSGNVDVIPALSTDARVALFEFETLEDDLGFFPKYEASPIIRMETLEEYPELEETINELADQITEDDMMIMNSRVDIDDEKPEEVARDFLIDKGLIKE